MITIANHNKANGLKSQNKCMTTQSKQHSAGYVRYDDTVYVQNDALGVHTTTSPNWIAEFYDRKQVDVKEKRKTIVHYVVSETTSTG